MDIRIEKATATRLPTEEEFGQIGERGKKKRKAERESGKEDNAMQRSEYCYRDCGAHN